MSHGKLLLAIHKQSLAIFPKMQQDKILFYALLVVHDHYSAESVEQDQTANDWSKVKVTVTVNILIWRPNLVRMIGWFYAAFNSISIILRRQVTLFVPFLGFLRY